MRKQKEVRFGCIGTGPRAQGMLRLYQKMKGCRITAICDKYEPLVAKTHSLLGDNDIVCYTDHRKMLKEANIEAILVIVEPENNANLVCEALKAGKHVMCEVPLAFALEDCWRVVHAVEKTGLKFQMAEQVRYFPFAQAWRQMVREGRLGKVLYVEGQYLHGMTEDRFWMDGETGARLSLDEAKNNPCAKKSRIWQMKHPILYLPHELSPILNILDDRVVKVTCMATRKTSYKYEWFDHSDFEVALMHTEKDTILRLMAGFTIQTLWRDGTGGHWYHLMGTQGVVETNRTNRDKMKMWFADSYMKDPAELTWEYDPHNTSAEALASGHGGSDYYPMASFIDSILKDKTPPMDVYRAAETAAPAIIAVQSVESGFQCLEVPNFRPGKQRKSAAMTDRPSVKGTTRARKAQS